MNNIKININSVIFILIATCFILDIYYRITMIFFNLQEYSWTMEANVITSFLRFESGLPLYSNIYVAPFSIVQYGPIWYHVELAFYSLISVFETDKVLAAYYSGRILSILSILGCMYCVTRIIKKLFDINFKKSFVVVCIPYFLIVTPHFFVSRPDSLALLLSIVAIYLFSLAKRWSYIMCGVVIVAAIFTKQNQIFTALGLFIYILFSRNWKSFWLLFTSCFVTTLVMLTYLYFKFDHYFFQNIVDGLANGTNHGLLQDRFMIIIALFAGLSFWSIATNYKKISNNNYQSNLLFVSTMATINLLGNIIASFKTGADMNYFVDFLFLNSLLIIGYTKIMEYKINKIELLVHIHVLILSLLICTNNWRFVKHSKFAVDNEKIVADYFYNTIKINHEDLIIYDQAIHNPLNNYIALNNFFPQLDVLSQINHGKEGIYIPLIIKTLANNKNLYLISTNENSQYNVMGFMPVECKLIEKINSYYIYKIIN